MITGELKNKADRLWEIFMDLRTVIDGINRNAKMA